jgi:DNA-binding response OmpR family regulator
MGLGCGVDPIVTAPACGHHRRVALSVLIVDDSAQFRDAAAELLAELGFDVLATAADADQALAAASDRPPDGVLLDVNLQGQDGFAVSKVLAAAWPGVRIVLTSASFDHVPDVLLWTSAAIAFVPKERLAGVDLGALFTR